MTQTDQDKKTFVRVRSVVESFNDAVSKFWKLSFRWPVIVAVFFFLAAASWLLAMFMTEQGDSGRYIQHNITFSIIHLTSFPLAAGLFTSVLIATEFPHKELKLPGKSKQSVQIFAVQIFAFIILVIFHAIVVSLVDNDFFGQSAQPYELTGRDATTALTMEKGLRKNFTDLKSTREKLESEFSDSIISRIFQDKLPENGKIRDKRDELSLQMGTYLGAKKEFDLKVEEYEKNLKPILGWKNSIAGWVGLALTAIYGCFAATVLWFGLMLIFLQSISSHTSKRSEREKLVVTFYLLSTWFPMRIYATWYQNYFLDNNDWWINYPALLILTMAGSVFLVILSFLGGKAISYVLLTANIAFTAIVTLADKLSPNLLNNIFGSLKNVLDETGGYFVVLILVAICDLAIMYKLLAKPDKESIFEKLAEQAKEEKGADDPSDSLAPST